MSIELKYTTDDFLNNYKLERLNSIEEEEKEEDEDKELKEVYDADYFMNLYRSGRDIENNLSSDNEEENLIEHRQALQEDIDSEKIEVDDVDLGEKEILIEEEKPTEYTADYFINQYNKNRRRTTGTPSQPLVTKIPTTEQKIELGTRLERHTLGNLYRMMKAGVLTLANNKTYKENIKNIEDERRTNIFEHMQKTYGIDFRKYEGDAAVIGGRVVTALGDPVTFFLPWAKIASLNKIRAAVAGSAIGGTDMAIYEYAAYGELNPNNILFGSVIGGASTSLGNVLANRFPSVAEPSVKIGKVDDSGVEQTVKSSVKDEPSISLNAKETDDLEEAVQILTRKERTTIQDLEITPVLVNLFNTAKNDIRLYREAKESFNKKLNPKTKKIEIAIDELPLINVSNPINPVKPLTKRQLNNLKKKSDKAKNFLENEWWDLYKAAAKNQVELVDGTLKILATNKNFQLTDNLLQKILYESFRPLFGGGVGFAAGTFIGDEDDYINWTLMGAGMTFGLLYNRVKGADYLLKGQKEKAFGIIDNESARMFHNFLKAKLAGTVASRGTNHGGVNELLSRNLFHQLDNKHTNIIGAEEASTLFKNMFFKRVVDVVGNATESQRIAAGMLSTKVATRAQIKKEFNFSVADMKNVDNLSANLKIFLQEFNEYVAGAGIKYKKIANYDLPQIYNFERILADPSGARSAIRKALVIEVPGLKGKKLTKAVNQTFENILGLSQRSMFKGYDNATGSLGNFTSIPKLAHFQQERVFKSLKARRALGDFLEKDIALALNQMVENTVKGAEFIRKFGTDGKILNKYASELKALANAGKITEKERKIKTNLIRKSVDSYFGMLHRSANDPFQSTLGKDIFATLTFLSNTTMLPRSIIPTLGDLVQPFQNSTLHSASRQFIKTWRKENIASKYGVGGQGRFGYGGINDAGSSVIQDLEGVLTSGAHPISNLQRKLMDATKLFFKYNLMAPGTNWAMKFSFSSTIDEVLQLSKKLKNTNRITRSTASRLRYYGLNKDDLKILSKFKTVEEALESNLAEGILLKVGNKGVKRDVLMPEVGNRMFFAQSNNPAIKSMGLFLSWAQTKVSQMNGLINRVEDGDLKLAIKMLGTLTIFAGLRELQILASPAQEYYEENKPERFTPKYWGEAFGLSGGIDWRVEKFTRIYAGLNGNGYGTPISAISPVISEIDKVFGQGGKTIRNLDAGDYEGAVVSLLKGLPLGSELHNYVNRASVALTDDKLLEDKPNKSKSTQLASRDSFYAGGLVQDKYPVPFVRKDPADRINPYTGEPYKEQMDRLGFVEGEIVDVDEVEKMLNAQQALEIISNNVLERISKGEPNPITTEEFKRRMKYVADKISLIESENTNVPKGGNKAGSSASGYYQFLGNPDYPQGPTQTAINRLNELSSSRRLNFNFNPNLTNEINTIRKNLDVSLGSRDTQDLLFYANIYEMPGSDKYLKDIAYGSDINKAGKNLYFKHHGMDTTSQLQLDATRKRANKYFGE